MGSGFGWIRVHQALVYGVIGAFMPYVPVHLAQLGMADWQIGWVMGSWGIAIATMPAFATHLADRHLSNRALLGLGYAGAAATLTALAFARDFVPFLLGAFAFSIACTPLFSLMNGLTFGAIHDARAAGGSPPAYHRVRFWGSVGFMVPAFVLFGLLRWGELDARAALFVAAALAAVGALTALALPLTRKDEGAAQGDDAAPRRLPSAEAWRHLRRPPVVRLVLPLFLMFLAMAVLYAFYPRHLLALGVADEWIGLIVIIGVLAELPLMAGASRILGRVGLVGVMVVGAGCLVVRAALLALVDDPGVAIATQVLHGPSVLALYLVPPLYLDLKAEPGYRNSMQGLYGVLCLGLARVVGSAVGGHAAEVGLAWAFALSAVLATVAMLALAVGFRDPEAQRALGARPEPAVA